MIKKVIIVDDSSTARMITRRCLEMGGLVNAQFMEATDGEVALNLVRRHPVDLVVTDLNMPNMDGQSLLGHLKSNSYLAELPVLVVSSNSNEAKQKELLQQGAFAVISKPLTTAGIADILHELTDGEDENRWDWS